ncbi:zinc ribbon domain-containing protein [Nocardia testacea]|uniref:zinc ribbon domain-containing protein n=1 Tax=Nocardia testacea TaxID=248551 RepID=UPI0033C274A4
MTVRCQYCGHSAVTGVSACANCGAPLPGPSGHDGPVSSTAHHGAAAGHLAELSGRAGALGAPEKHGHHSASGTAAPEHRDSEHHGHGHHGHGHDRHHHGVLGFVRSHLVDEAETVVHKHHPKWQWRAAGGIAVAVLLVLAFLMVKSCTLTGPPLTGPAGFGPGGPVAATDAVSALPAPLRSASCRPHDETDGVQSCVLDAGSPLLMGEITGGRQLAFQVQTAAPAALAQAIAQWRSAAGTVVTDGEVFAAISSSAAIWYADTQSGLRVDTGAFTDSAGARTFLVRSGLLHP